MKTKYGADIPPELLYKYFCSLVNKCFKLLPLYESVDIDQNKYLRSLLYELCGCKNLIVDELNLFELICNLESLLNIESHQQYKSQVFKCINICNKLKEGVKINGL